MVGLGKVFFPVVFNRHSNTGNTLRFAVAIIMIWHWKDNVKHHGTYDHSKARGSHQTCWQKSADILVISVQEEHVQTWFCFLVGLTMYQWKSLAKTIARFADLVISNLDDVKLVNLTIIVVQKPIKGEIYKKTHSGNCGRKYTRDGIRGGMDMCKKKIINVLT